MEMDSVLLFPFCCEWWSWGVGFSSRVFGWAGCHWPAWDAMCFKTPQQEQEQERRGQMGSTGKGRWRCLGQLVWDEMEWCCLVCSSA